MTPAKKFLTVLAAVAALSACTPEQGREAVAINEVRSRTGHPTLPWSEDLGDIAQRYADRLSYPNFPLAHNPLLAQELNRAGLPWLSAGENVGCGDSQFGVFTASLFSPDHRRDILSEAWDLVGTGVSTRDGKTCTVQVFVDLG